MPHAVRRLLATPGFTAVALLTLALGIGVNTTMFSVLRAFVVRTLPYPDEHRLVQVHRTSGQAEKWPHSVANFLDLRAQQTVFTQLAAFQRTTFNLALPGQPAEQIRGLHVTADFFPLLGVAPALGRVFTAVEERSGRDRVLILSHRCWTTRFARDPAIVGRDIRVGGHPFTVVGVMPPGFEDPLLWGTVDAWQPLAFSDAQRANRRSNLLRVVARLKPDLSRDQAEAGLKTLWAQLVTAHEVNAKTSLRLDPLNYGSQVDDGFISWFIMALAALVLLIGCANLANLQFARTAARAREHAIRAALGATRAKLMRDVLAESLLLALAGGALGVLLALWCNDLLSRHFLVGGSQRVAISLDVGVFLFALLTSTVVGIAFGLLPALLASRTDVTDALKQGGRGATASRTQHRVRHTLIVAEVALALVLLATASLFLRGLERITQRDPGWRVAGLLTGHLNIQSPSSAETPQQRTAYRLAFVQQLEQQLAALPGVERVAFGTALPTYGINFTSSVVVENRPQPAPGAIPSATLAWITPDYFATLDLPLVSGRAFTASDRAGSPAVTIVNESMARAFFPGENPIGRRLRHPDEKEWREIVGVVRDAQPAATFGLGDPGHQMYQPYAQNPSASLELALRAHVAPETLAPAVRRIVASLHPDQAIEEVDLLHNELERAMTNIRLGGWTLAAFAALGLLLAAIGIYAVIANSVVQRTSEIGIRMALGAQVRDILRLVLGQGFRLATLGTVLGLAGAFATAHILRATAPALAEIDLLALVAVVGLILVVAALACYLPARRAARVDPIIALRSE